MASASSAAEASSSAFRRAASSSSAFRRAFSASVSAASRFAGFSLELLDLLVCQRITVEENLKARGQLPDAHVVVHADLIKRALSARREHSEGDGPDEEEHARQQKLRVVHHEEEHCLHGAVT